jgi:hypothetical protein
VIKNQSVGRIRSESISHVSVRSPDSIISRSLSSYPRSGSVQVRQGRDWQKKKVTYWGSVLHARRDLQRPEAVLARPTKCLW